MPTSYPDALDDFDAFPATSPVGAKLGEPVGGRTHSQWHRDLADAVLALQRKVGVDPLTVAMSGGSVHERGQTVAAVDLAWTVSKAISAQAMTGPSAPVIAADDRAASIAGPFTTDATWTLSATAADGVETASAAASVVFRSRRWWGVSPLADLTDADVLALAGSEIATGRTQSRVLDCTGGRYVWMAWPAEFGAPAFWMGGLLNTAWTETIRDHVNAYGHTRSYRLYRTQYLQAGSVVDVEVR